MSIPCNQWMELADRETLGESLDTTERALLVQHAAKCELCGREAALFGELEALCNTESERRAPPARRRAFWAYGAAGLLAAAAACLLLFVREPPLHVRVLEGEQLEVAGESLQVGDTLALGATALARERGCLHVEPGVRVCLAAGTRLRVAQLSAHERRLELLEGKLIATLEPQPAGSSFGISTREGSAVAVGTVFSVEVPGRGDVVTRVLHGVVSVQDRAGGERHVSAHRQTSMTGPVSDLPIAQEQRELELNAPTQRASELANASELRPASERASSAARKEAARSTVPSSEAQPAPVPSLAPERPRRASLAQVERSGKAPATPLLSAPEPAAPTQPATARALLLAARARSAEGDHEAALTAYRALFASAAESAEAKVAWVPYGELLLSRGEALSALQAFQSYLAAGGALSEEASYGRIRALRALHDTAAERRAVAAFLRDHPGSALAGAMRVGGLH